MAYTKYSLTPANNTATPPDGAPEGMLPSAVNDTMRDMMAQIRDVGDGIRNGTYTMTAPVITGGSITGVALSGNTFTNPVITGGSINNTPIGASTANSGAFTTLSASGVATISAGTVSAPALTTTGDTNTGIFFPAADTIAFTEGGVEAMRIDSTGSIGIGTTAPTVILDVNVSNPTRGIINRIRNSSSSSFTGAQLLFTQNTIADWSIGQPAGTNAFAFWSARNSSTDGTEVMRIDSSGNVGIGTSSPASNRRLDATINQNNSAGIRTTNTSTGASASSNITCANATNNAEFGILGSGYGGYGVLSANGAYIYTNTGAIQLAADNNFIAFGTGTGVPERMRITSNGRVGINSSNPSGTLEVFGVINTTSGNAASAANGLHLYFNTTTNICTIAGYHAGVDWRPIVYNASYHAWQINDNEKMRITAGGEVFIAGTTDQGAYNLQVNGTGVWGAGAYVNGSDERIKDNIAPLDSGLDVVTKLNPVTYKYKEDWSKDQSTQTGFIAQELLTALEGKNYVDGIVQQGGEYMSVAYQNIIPILTKAIQEQQAMIEKLKQEVAKLKGV